MTKKVLQDLASKLMKQRAVLPTAKVGEYAIEHEFYVAGDELFIVNIRNALFSGLPVCDHVCTGPTVIHKLTYDGGTWMTDLPCELVQMHNELAKFARGHVLIGGLGLGLLTKMVAAKANVKKVTVVEMASEVIELMRAVDFGPKVTIVQGDIHQFAKETKLKFDVALLDTWQGTGEMVFVEDVVPLRRALAGKAKKVFCWQEGVMLGQVVQGMFRAADLPALLFADSSYQAHMYAWRRAVEAEGLRGAPRIDIKGAPDATHFQKLLDIQEENSKDERLRAFAWVFLHTIGSPYWEETFGGFWDEVWNKKEEVA